MHFLPPPPSVRFLMFACGFRLSFFRRENVCTSWLLVSRSPAPVRSSPRILRATKKRGSNAITTDRGLRDKRRNHVGVGERAQKIATLDGGFLGCLGCLGWPIRELEETQVAAMWTGWPFKGANSEQRAAVINHVQQALQSHLWEGGTEGGDESEIAP